MTVLRQLPPTQIVTDQKQLENVNNFNYFGNVITNDARCIHEINLRTAVAKAAFNKQKALSASKLGLNLREKTSKVLHLEHSSVRS
jgi:hypothetical protein